MNTYPAVIIDTIRMCPVFWVPLEKATDTAFLDTLPDSIEDYDVITEPKELERYTQKELVELHCSAGHETKRIRDKVSGSVTAFRHIQAMPKLKEFTGKQTKHPVKEKKVKLPTRVPDASKAHVQAKELVKAWYQEMKDDPTNENDTRKTRSEMVADLMKEFTLKESTAGQYIQHVRAESPECLPKAGSTRQLVFEHIKTSLYMKEARQSILKEIQDKFGLTLNTAKNYYQKARQEFLDQKI